MRKKGPTMSKNDEKNQSIETVFNTKSGKICLSPCEIRCPLGEHIQRNHAMISQLDKKMDNPFDAMITIGHELFEKNPLFPIICGNICGLCEEDCNYKDKTGAVRRRKIIWPIGEQYLKYLETAPALPHPTKEHVAIIGGGPSGLMCAIELRKQGYAVTIFDKNPELGGALRYIPKYRLPTKILDSLITNLIRIYRIQVKTEVTFGKGGISVEQLKKKGFQAMFIATGTPSPRILSIESESPWAKSYMG